MFIPDRNCQIRILTVIKLSWNKALRTTGPRAFHALSFKEYGDSEYYYENKTIKAETGDILFAPKGVGYAQKHEASTVYVVHFDCNQEIASRDFEVFKIKNPKEYQQLFKDMYTIWNSKEKGSELLVQSLFYLVLYMLRNEQTLLDRNNTNLRIDAILKYINDNYHDTSLSVESLAEMYGTSTTYFRRAFEKETKESPRQYITHLRLSNAKSLMKTGYYTITEAAIKSGFTNQKYFSRLFMSRFGITPSEYMKQHSYQEMEV